MLMYIPGTLGKLFKTNNDNYVRSFSGKKLKFLSDINKDRLLVEEDLKEVVFIEKKLSTVYKLWYPNDKIVYLVEIENEE